MPSPLLRGLNFGSGLAVSDPHTAYLIDRAFAEVRAADKRGRDLIRLDIAAKHFAISVITLEDESVADEMPGPPAE